MSIQYSAFFDKRQTLPGSTIKHPPHASILPWFQSVRRRLASSIALYCLVVSQEVPVNPGVNLLCGGSALTLPSRLVIRLSSPDSDTKGPANFTQGKYIFRPEKSSSSPQQLSSSVQCESSPARLPLVLFKNCSRLHLEKAERSIPIRHSLRHVTPYLSSSSTVSAVGVSDLPHTTRNGSGKPPPAAPPVAIATDFHTTRIARSSPLPCHPFALGSDLRKAVSEGRKQTFIEQVRGQANVQSSIAAFRDRGLKRCKC